MRSIITLITAIILAETLKAQTINLSGTWQFSTDSIDWSETIQLPGSMLENRKGEPVSINTQWTASIYDSSYYYNPHWAAFRQPGEIKLPFFLTPDYHYIGKAWYKRTIDIDKKYPDAILFLERVHIASSLYINGQYIGTQNSLSVPHRYPVGEHLHAGKNEILICIDNDPDLVGVGKDSHSISDQTQGNWNGIVGKITIETTPNMPPYPTDSTFRKFEIRGKMFYVNNRKTFLRGTVDNCNFPLTGYPPMDKESWIKIFAQCQEYGFNHVRFHSYCPPEAAFLAADSLNIILQVEGPSWPNHGVRLGVGEKVDTYLWDELDKIIKEYGHHPSFCMLSAGNEPRGKWTQWVEKFTEYWSNSDSRRVYTGASVGWGWAWLPKNPYHVKAGARGLSAWNSEIPNTMDDHRDRIDSISVPFVCHELGQWCAFPNIADTTKYTGVYKAGNLSIFDYQMKRNGIESMSEKFHYSSGKLQLLCYKYEIEKVLRTPNYAGYQMLSLNDYTGQGTAPVGLTNVFYEDKEYCKESDTNLFTPFSSDIVPLIRVPKFVYKHNETITVNTEITQFIDDSVDVDINYYYTIGVDTIRGTLSNNTTLCSGNNNIGCIEIPAQKHNKAEKIELTIEVRRHGANGLIGHNSWNFWLYPEIESHDYNDIYVTDTLNNEAIERLKTGGKVLLLANKRLTYGRGIEQHFLPIFWNTSWFQMRPPHTTGMYIDKDHKIFHDFVTDCHSDIQWWELVNEAPVILMSDFPKHMQPIVQPIDTWFISRKLGMLVEAKVYSGKIIVTSFDLTTDLDHRIVARQMKESILNYMKSPSFSPHEKIDIDIIRNLFIKQTPNEGIYTKEKPDELIMPSQNK